MTSAPNAFTKAMHQSGLPHENCGIVVAFSGGTDSIALLDMVWAFTHKSKEEFKHYTIPVLAFHVHHGIRGPEADRDADFCREFCHRHGIPFEAAYVDAPSLAKKEHLTLEEAARKARYGAICDYLVSHPEYTHVLTAHHKDDQAETLLFRLLRGSGAKGFSGISEKRTLTLSDGRCVTLLRPLLSLAKKELLAYCEDNKLPYVYDSTNEENEATRNRIRNVVLPEISKINPSFSDALIRFSTLQSMDNAYLTAKANEFYHALPPQNGGFTLALLKDADDAILTRVIALWFQDICEQKQQTKDAAHKTPLAAEHILGAVSLIREGKSGSLSFPARLSFSVDVSAGVVRLTVEKEQTKQFFLPLEYGKVCTLLTGETFLLLEKGVENEELHHLQNIYKFVISTTINSDTIVGSLFLRARKDNIADTYLCGGSHKTAKDALSAHRVPLHRRGALPLVCDQSGIVWIPFCGIRDDVNPKFAKAPRPLVIYYFYNDV